MAQELSYRELPAACQLEILIRISLLVFVSVMITFTGVKFKRPSLKQFEESIMLNTTNYDVVILGTGPAGLQAAIHAARKKVSVLLLGKETKSSLFHAHVENFCSLFNVKGEDMLNVGRQQAVNFGSDVLEEDVLQVKQIVGQSSVEEVVLKNGSKIPVNGVFIELGAKGVMELATHLGVQLDDQMKYIQTNKKMETNVPGVFAAGDICGPPWQMAKAVGEGCVAGLGAAGYARKPARTG
jgi:thioredoxin reductase